MIFASPHTNWFLKVPKKSPKSPQKVPKKSPKSPRKSKFFLNVTLRVPYVLRLNDIIALVE